MLLCLSGSLRRESYNTALLREAAATYGGAAEFGDLRLPLYDGDAERESGIPPKVAALADRIAAAEAVVLSSPEYNKMLSGVMKNALDWISRVRPHPLAEKPVAVLAASAGVSGGARARYSLLTALVAFRVRFSTGPEILVGQAGGAFDPEGKIVDPKLRALLAEAMTRLREEAGR
jgi:chromate reductase, NAD(P)H dehydrogenase (quinone)